MVRIGEREVGPEQPAYVIAEIGINHGGDVEVAKRLVSAAAESGADAAKLQTYDTEQRVARDSPIYDVLKTAELDAAAHGELAKVAADAGIQLISTPFDAASVALLAEIGVPAYKIASFDIVNLALLDAVAAQGKPVIMSRGMADADETDRAVELLRERGIDMVLLHAVSAYPLEPRDANLAMIGTLRERYDAVVGWSDHTLDIDVPALAVAAGASAVEKHFTLDRAAEGPDHALSADPEMMARMVSRIREVEEILGDGTLRLLDAEEGTVPYRRPSTVP